MKFHTKLYDALYKHHYKIRSVAKEILGINSIDHFSLDLVDPNDNMLFFSSTPSHGFEICKRGYGQYDGIISPYNYENHEFYWWKEAAHKKYADKIAKIREDVLQLKHGFMLVRHWDNFYLIYSFATRSKTKSFDFQTKVVNEINYFFKMGDFVYQELKNIYASYCQPFEPPNIEVFYPFSGGKPPAHFSKHYKKTNARLLIPHTSKDKETNNVIYLNFSQKKHREK